jgi:hypothetical protein
MGSISYRTSTETVAAATLQTITFSDAVLPQGGIQDLFIVTTGVNNHLGSAIDLVRVKLNGVAWIDLPALQLRALIEALAPANTVPPSGTLRFTIPCSLPRFQLPAFRGLIGIPFGARTSVEIQFNAANASAGTAQANWRMLSGPPTHMMRAIQSTTQVAANSTSARIEIKTGLDPVVGFTLPLVGSGGITRCRIVQMVDGQENQIVHAAQGGLIESQFLENPVSVTSAIFLRLPDGPYVMPPGSYIEVDTGASSAATDAYAAVTLVKL